MLNLSELAFKVNTDALVQAAEKIAALGKSVESLQGSFSKLEKGAAASEKALAEVNIKNAQAAKANAEAALLQAKTTTEVEKAERAREKAIQSTTKATEEQTKSVSTSVSVLQRQSDIYGFMIEGFSKGQSSILATAKAAGIAAEEMKNLQDVLQAQRTIMGGDPFDKSLGSLKSLQNEFKVLKEVQRLYTAEIPLTRKQMENLALDKLRLVEAMKAQGKSFSAIKTELQNLNAEYIATAGGINRLVQAENQIDKAHKDTANANAYLEKEMQRVNYALQTQNNELNKGTANALFRFEQNLKRSGLTLAEQKKKLDDYRTSLLALEKAKGSTQTDYISRALGPQITDIFVGLATGQNPLTVMLQQGGQLRDQFALAGVAAGDMGDTMRRAAKDMVVSVAAVAGAFKDLLVGAFIDTGKGVIKLVGNVTMLNDALEWTRYQLTLLSFQHEGVKVLLGAFEKFGTVLRGGVGAAAGVAAGTIVALGVAAYQTMKEQDKLAQSLALYNGTLAVSHKSSLEYVAALNDVGVTTGNASAAITQMAKAGVFASEDITLVAKSAANLADYSDVAVEDTIKSFAKLKEKPVEALLEIAKQTGMVSIETIKMVEELQKAGKQSEASALAMQAYADVTTNQVDRMKETYSSFGLFVMDLGKKIKNFFSQVFKDIFYVSTESLRRDIAKLEEMTAGYSNVPGYDPRRHELQALKDKLALMELESAAFEEQIRSNTEAAKAEDLVIKLREDANKVIDKSIAKTLSLSEFTKQYVKEKTKSQKVDADTLALVERAAEVEWKSLQKKGGGGSSASSSLDIERTNEISILERSFERENKLRQKALQDRLSMEKTAYELGRTTKAEYMKNELDILRETLNAEEKTTGETLAKREQLYLQDTAAAIAAYQKRVASNAGLKNADKQNAEALVNLQTELGNSARAYEDFIEKAKASSDALKSNVSAKEFEVYKKLAENIKETAKALEEYNFANANRIREQSQEYSERKALRWATPEQAAVIKAVAEATKFYASELAKLQKVAEKAKAAYNDQVYFFGSDSPQAQEALRNYEAALGNVNQAVADARVAKEQAATDAITDYYDAEFKRISDGVTDSLVTALFEGGKAGSKKFRDLVVAELRKPVTMVVNAVVNTLLGNILGSLMGGAAAGAAGGAAGGIAGSIGSSIAGSAIVSGIGMMGTEGLANIVGMLGGDSLGVLASGATGGFSSAIASAIGQIPVWGWIAGGLLAIAAVLDDSGTYHTGGAASYSAATGQRNSLGFRDNEEGLPSYNPNDNIDNQFGLGFGYVETGKETISAVEALSKALVDIFDGVAKTFGKTAGYEVATAFADDSSKDGAWGALAVRLQGVEILNWDDFRQSKWAPKEFGDGEGGYKEYLTAIAKDTKKIILDMDLPSWASSVLEAIGSSPSIESISKALQEISQIKAVYDVLTSKMVNFANVSDDSFSAILRKFGDVTNLANLVSTYYAAYYTDIEKFQYAQADLVKSFELIGVAMPESKEAFRSLVEAQDLNTEAGRDLYAQLLAVAGTFDSVTSMATQYEKDIKDVAENITSKEIELLRAQGKQTEANAKQLEQTNRLRSEEYNQLLKVNPQVAKLTLTFWDLEDSIVEANKAAEVMSAIPNVLKKYLTDAEWANYQIRDVANNLVKAGVGFVSVSDAVTYLTSNTKNEIKEAATALFEMGDLSLDQKAILLESASIMADLKDSTAKLAEDITKAFKKAGEDIVSYIRELTVGRAGLATPTELLEKTRQVYSKDLQAASAGDSEAAGRLVSSAKAYIDAQKTVTTSSKTTDDVIKTIIAQLSGLGFVSEELSTGGMYIPKYANGGIFSNSVVTQPTMFNVAQMGEAGPEAIMPLSRSSSGKLGVTSDNSGTNRLLEKVALELQALREQQSQETANVISTNVSVTQATTQELVSKLSEKQRQVTVPTLN